MFRVLVISIFMLGAVHAQPAPQPTTIDPQLWGEMLNAIGGVSMPAPAHQQVQAIIANVQREAQSREMRAKAVADTQKKPELSKE